MTTYYVSIGNTDNKLTQLGWSNFCRDVDSSVRRHCEEVYGARYSESSAAWQNACWGFSMDGFAEELKVSLRRLCALYHQDAIAWAEVAETEFLS